MIYGILLSIFLGILATIFSFFIPGIGSVAIAIFLGILVRNLFLKNQSFIKGVNLTEKKLLPIAIMLLGTELNFTILMKLGLKSLIFITLMITITILTGAFISRFFGFNKKFGLLLGTGNAVCGSSAIAATAPILEADDESIGLSIAAVNLMGTFGIFFMPIIGSIVGFSDLQKGTLIGGTLQAVGQVVASGFSVNNNVGAIATAIKMGRVLSLGIVIIILDLIMSKEKIKLENKNSKFNIIKIPYFIIGFFVLSIISSINIFPIYIINFINRIGKWLLVFSMAAVGLKINFSALIEKGKKLILLELLIEIVQIFSAILLIKIIF
ncbi:putative integral membrane protein (TIGR00698 family) [Hypnocyclicus thermotrophus]|uniref:Integral membrane protein (TIGR00698 family) n=1 Tax=Hypnocyclicus thermotrophus TaxID=1627895 RepID=A0AA46DX04_9FUSO|nr:putative sulfate exporter family transporter [Hypnocyclicus thermotrophus]TDT67341.1 putative integral membrane protein (TIGR00698 family) [Hypnocyclicus thermotrophus]